jgi:hypothetical protein
VCQDPQVTRAKRKPNLRESKESCSVLTLVLRDLLEKAPQRKRNNGISPEIPPKQEMIEQLFVFVALLL